MVTQIIKSKTVRLPRHAGTPIYPSVGLYAVLRTCFPTSSTCSVVLVFRDIPCNDMNEPSRTTLVCQICSSASFESGESCMVIRLQ